MPPTGAHSTQRRMHVAVKARNISDTCVWPTKDLPGVQGHTGLGVSCTQILRAESKVDSLKKWIGNHLTAST
jgi:hypothetical protein